jgi:Cdc6-like AAA superfamily ATPase
MKVDLGLQVAANAFIEAMTPLVQSIETVPVTTKGTARRRVIQEAYDLSCAFIDADRRATDDELWALIMAFAPVLERDLLHETPESLRAAGTTKDARAYLMEPSALFRELLAADVAKGTSWSTTYYQHAVALGFMTASLDDYTDRAELVAIEQFRSMLLGAIRRGSIDTTAAPPQEARPPGAEAPDAPSAERSHDAGPPAAAATEAAAEAEAEEPLPPPRPLDELLHELDGLVGMAAVKAEVKLVANLIRVQQLRRERGLKVLEQSHHLIFTGNPGTGKTTVARLVAQIYRTLGVVAKGQLVETDRSGLVAGFVGQTAPKVVAAFDKADEGVLLIDEAYALVRGSENDFGQEAIDTIVKLIEDRRDRIVVIAAGYPDEMNDFVNANPGLKSRFPKTLAFPDYTSDELVQIFQKLCDNANYLCDADAKAKVRLWLESQPRVKGFGNGRLVRNLFEDAVSRQASRVVDLTKPTDIELVLMVPADIPDPPPLPVTAPATAAAPDAAGT